MILNVQAVVEVTQMVEEAVCLCAWKGLNIETCTSNVVLLCARTFLGRQTESVGFSQLRLSVTIWCVHCCNIGMWRDGGCGTG